MKSKRRKRRERGGVSVQSLVKHTIQMCMSFSCGKGGDENGEVE